MTLNNADESGGMNSLLFIPGADLCGSGSHFRATSCLAPGTHRCTSDCFEKRRSESLVRRDLDDEFIERIGIAQHVRSFQVPVLCPRHGTSTSDDLISFKKCANVHTRKWRSCCPILASIHHQRRTTIGIPKNQCSLRYSPRTLNCDHHQNVKYTGVFRLLCFPNSD